MGISKKADLQEMAELEGVIKGLGRRAQAVRTVMQNDRIFEDGVRHHEEAIALHTKQLAELRYEREHGFDILDQIRRDVDHLRKKVKRIKHRADITRILELEKQINSLKGSIHDKAACDAEEVDDGE